MTKRLQILFSLITPCAKFADIGCDHGYIAQAVIKSEKCRNVIVSDISPDSLSKAEALLAPYNGNFSAVVSDGFDKLEDGIDQALIAGMGGEEIVNILSKARYLPKRLILQPMKNSDKVRALLIAKGYRLVKDYLFCDVKFYDVIVAEKLLNGEKPTEYTDKELLFGRDNLISKSDDFIKYVLSKIDKLKIIEDEPSLSEESKDNIRKRISELEELL